MKNQRPWSKRILETVAFLILFVIVAPLILFAGILALLLLLIVGILFSLFWNGEDPTDWHTHAW